MMNKNRSGSFFGTMVLMGASLGSGCGGLAEEDRETEGPVASGGTSGEDEGRPSGGATATTGGAIAVGGSDGFADDFGIGGGEVTFLPTEPPPQCAPYQLVCEIGSCGGVPQGCACSTFAPDGPSSCAAGESLLCSNTFVDVSSGAEVPYNCQCVLGEDDCRAACDAAGIVSALSCHDVEDGLGGAAAIDAIVCGCAVLVLK